MGRPKSVLPTRDKAVMFYLTPEDASYFNEFANDYGFKSRSQLFTGIMESLRVCGFSPFGSMRMGVAIQKQCETHNKEASKQGGFDFHTLSLRPVCVLPEVEETTLESINRMISELKKQAKELKK